MCDPWLFIVHSDHQSTEVIGRVALALGYEVLVAHSLHKNNCDQTFDQSEFVIFQVDLPEGARPVEPSRFPNATEKVGLVLISPTHPLFEDLSAEFEAPKNVFMKLTLEPPLTEEQIRCVLS